MVILIEDMLQNMIFLMENNCTKNDQNHSWSKAEFFVIATQKIKIKKCAIGHCRHIQYFERIARYRLGHIGKLRYAGLHRAQHFG